MTSCNCGRPQRVAHNGTQQNNYAFELVKIDLLADVNPLLRPTPFRSSAQISPLSRQVVGTASRRHRGCVAQPALDPPKRHGGPENRNIHQASYRPPALSVAVSEFFSARQPAVPQSRNPSMTTLKAQYEQRFRRVAETLDTHLHEALTLERISALAATSKYHFHRQFAAWFGLTLHQYVHLARIKRAAYELAFRDTRILDVALTSGYESNEAFTRAFKSSVGQTPSKFRSKPQWPLLHAAQQPLITARSAHMSPSPRLEDVTIVAFPETRVAALEHRDSAAMIGASIRRFIDWRKHNRLPPRVSATFNVQHQSHPDVPDAEYHVDLCAQTHAPITPNPQGVVAKTIPAGRCAVLRHRGSDDTLPASVMFLYASWLPNSGHILRDYPLFFQRIQFFPDVPESDAITDVFLPIE